MKASKVRLGHWELLTLCRQFMELTMLKLEAKIVYICPGFLASPVAQVIIELHKSIGELDYVYLLKELKRNRKWEKSLLVINKKEKCR